MAGKRAAPAIYLVSASSLMRHSHESLFRALGHDVHSFDTVERFLLGRADAAGCLCIDVQGLALPIASCLRLLRRRRCDLPVVLLTGQLSDAYRAVLGRLHAPLAVLTKPVSGRRLLEAVEALWRGTPPALRD